MSLTRKTRTGQTLEGDWSDLKRWVAQLDAAQRRACAVDVEGRLGVLERIIKLVVDAKRAGRLG
jgi:hypothetical protein